MTETTTTTHKHQTFPVDGFENDFTLELMLFEQVTNAKEISDSIKSGSFDVEVALMNPKTIFTENIVRLATFKAIASMETKPTFWALGIYTTSTFRTPRSALLSLTKSLPEKRSFAK